MNRCGGREDDGRLPRGGEGAGCCATSLFFEDSHLHSQAHMQPMEDGHAERSQGHMKKKMFACLLCFHMCPVPLLVFLI